MASVSKRTWTHNGQTKSAWIVRYVDRTGAHRQKTFERKKDADNHRAKIEGERAALGYVYHVSDRTLAQVAAEYSRYEDQRLEDGRIKRGSHKNIMQTLRVSILPHLGKMRVSEIDAATVERFYEALRFGDKLAPETARTRVIHLQAMFDFAKRRNLAKSNPAAEALVAIGRAAKPKIRTLAPEEVKHLLETASVRGKFQHAQTWRLTEVAAHLAAFCALRIGEILALRLSDLDLASREVHVRHTVNEWDELTVPKTPDSLRVVPMPPHVVELVKSWIRHFYIPNERQLVFRRVFSRRGATGGPITVSGFNVTYWRPLTVRAGLDRDGDHLHFHALRHFAASWWLSNRMPITDAAKLMGHANANVTLGIYAHSMLSQRERSNAVDTMAQSLLAGADAQGLRNSQKALEYQHH